MMSEGLVKAICVHVYKKRECNTYIDGRICMNALILTSTPYPYPIFLKVDVSLSSYHIVSALHCKPHSF